MSPSQSRLTPTRTVVALCTTEMVALGSLAVPATVALALKVRDLDTGLSDEAALSVVAATGAVAALLASPVFGWLSDRSPAPNRARWVLGGVLAGAAISPLTLFVDSLLGLTLIWAALQVAYNSTFAGLYGTIADVVPERDRSRVAGWFSGSVSGSVVVALGLVALLPKTIPVLFMLMPTLAVLVAVPAYRHLRRLERPERTATAERGGWRAVLRASGQYWWVWSQRLLTQLAHAIVLMFGVFYLVRRTGMDDDRAATWVSVTAAVAALLSVVAAIGCGRLAGRRGSYGPFIAGAIGLLMVALAVKSVTTTPIAYHVATLLAGVGIGAYYAVDLALVLRTIPATNAGAFLGFFNIARALPQSLAPLLAPALLALGDGDLVGADRSQNYFALYVFGLLVALVALALLVPIRVLRREAVEEPAATPARNG